MKRLPQPSTSATPAMRCGTSEAVVGLILSAESAILKSVRAPRAPYFQSGRAPRAPERLCFPSLQGAIGVGRDARHSSTPARPMAGSAPAVQCHGPPGGDLSMYRRTQERPAWPSVFSFGGWKRAGDRNRTCIHRHVPGLYQSANTGPQYKGYPKNAHCGKWVVPAAGLEPA